MLYYSGHVGSSLIAFRQNRKYGVCPPETLLFPELREGHEGLARETN